MAENDLEQAVGTPASHASKDRMPRRVSVVPPDRVRAKAYLTELGLSLAVGLVPGAILIGVWLNISVTSANRNLGDWVFWTVVGVVAAFGAIVILSYEKTWYPRTALVMIVGLIGTLVILASILCWALSGRDKVGCSTGPAGSPSCAFSQPLRTRLDAVYFVLTTITTVGYGDITPVSQPARRAVVAIMATSALVLVIGLGLFFFALGKNAQSGSPFYIETYDEEPAAEVD